MITANNFLNDSSKMMNVAGYRSCTASNTRYSPYAYPAEIGKHLSKSSVKTIGALPVDEKTVQGSLDTKALQNELLLLNKQLCSERDMHVLEKTVLKMCHEEELADVQRENDDLRSTVKVLELQLLDALNNDKKISVWERTRLMFQNRKMMLQQATHSKAEMDQLRNERDECLARINDVNNCVICLEKEPIILFTPCNHLVCCKLCSEKVDQCCPNCRCKVLQKIRVYK